MFAMPKSPLCVHVKCDEVYFLPFLVIHKSIIMA
jgi:hypothetical protein